MSDERNGLPSASKMQRVTACPWSHKAECMFPPGDTNDAAESGRKIHSVLAFEASADTLTAAEAETAEMCAAAAVAVQAEWQGEAAGEHLTTMREQRLWLHKGNLVMRKPGSAAKFSGQADLIVFDRHNRRALVIDYKTGRGEQTTAVDNAQLASLAVLVSNYLDAETVRVAIVQPWAGKPTVADYGYDDLQTASKWLHDTLLRADNALPEMARAGEHCKWCRAASHNSCVAFRQYTDAVPALIQPESVAAMKPAEQTAVLLDRAMAMPAAELAEAIGKLGLVTKAIDALKDAAKQRAASDPEFQSYFGLREKAGRRSVTDVGVAFARAASYGVSADAFTAKCSISMTNLRELLAKATGSKGKDLDAIESVVIDGITKQSEPTIELSKIKNIEA